MPPVGVEESTFTLICHLLHFWSSSEPSPQSSEPSHTQWEEMQRWFPHSNWVDVQNLSAKDGKDSSEFWRNYFIYPSRKSHFSMCSGKLKEKQSGFSGMLCVFKKKKKGGGV